MFELADVVAVLLEPPASGRAVLTESRDGELTTFQVAWRTERGTTPGAWYVRAQRSSGKHVTSTFDGQRHRHFVGLQLAEESPGRTDFWHPALHLILPIKGFFWGRSWDDWRMHDDVQTEGEQVRVRLTRVDGRDFPGSLLVDMTHRVLVHLERAGAELHMDGFRTDRPIDIPLDRVDRRISNEAWLGPELSGGEGHVRYAG